MHYKNFILLSACILIPVIMYAQQSEDTIATNDKYYSFSFNGWNELSFNSLFTLFPHSNNDSMKRSLGVNGGSVISSNALNLSFSVAALTNEFIDTDLKNSVSEDLFAMNVFETEHFYYFS